MVLLSISVAWPPTSAYADRRELGPAESDKGPVILQLLYSAHLAQTHSVQDGANRGAIMCCHTVLYRVK